MLTGTLMAPETLLCTLVVTGAVAPETLLSEVEVDPTVRELVVPPSPEEITPEEVVPTLCVVGAVEDEVLDVLYPPVEVPRSKLIRKIFIY